MTYYDYEHELIRKQQLKRRTNRRFVFVVHMFIFMVAIFVGMVIPNLDLVILLIELTLIPHVLFTMLSEYQDFSFRQADRKFYENIANTRQPRQEERDTS